MSPLAVAGAVVLAYLAGSFPTGILVARLRGVDLRKIGSGNIGATNVARSLGKKVGILVFFVDALKGFLPTLLARLLWLDEPSGALVVAAIGVTAVLGHVFPLWLGFRGGKGVATAAVVFLALSPLAVLAAFIVWAALYGAFRISSVGSLAASATLPLALLALHAPTPFVVPGVAVCGLIWWRHRTNIARLLHHEERRV